MIFEDRSSIYPHRYLLTNVNGEKSYITLERADEPVVEGTPLNAETFNALVEECETLAAAMAGASRTLLWSNGSPFKTFGEQTIDLGAVANVYDGIEVVFCNAMFEETREVMNTGFIPIASERVFGLEASRLDSEKVFFRRRGTILVNSTNLEIRFDRARHMEYSDTSSAQLTATVLIPMMIYGIKGAKGSSEEVGKIPSESEVIKLDIFPEQDVEFLPMSDTISVYTMEGYHRMPVPGESYKVVWGGTETTCVATKAVFDGRECIGIGNAAIVGLGEDTGEPFLFGVFTDGSSCGFYTTDFEETRKVRVYQELYPAYLPAITDSHEGKVPRVVDGALVFSDVSGTSTGNGSVELDTTLTKSGKAADAGAVGAAIQQATEGVNNAFTQVYQEINNLDLAGKTVGGVALETYIGNAVNSYIEEALGGEF